MHYVIFKPLPGKYDTINLKDCIPSNSHPAEIKDTLLGKFTNSLWLKKIKLKQLCSIFCTKDLS